MLARLADLPALTAGGDLHPFCVGRPGRPQHHGDGACPVRQGARAGQRSSDFAVWSITPPTARPRFGFRRRAFRRSGRGWRSTARCRDTVALPGLEPALRLSTRVMAVRTVAAGAASATAGNGGRRAPLGRDPAGRVRRRLSPPRARSRGPPGRRPSRGRRGLHGHDDGGRHRGPRRCAGRRGHVDRPRRRPRRSRSTSWPAGPGRSTTRSCAASRSAFRASKRR